MNRSRLVINTSICRVGGCTQSTFTVCTLQESRPYITLVSLLRCALQLLAEVKGTLQHQITVEYNATATYSSQKRSRTHRLTVAWDSLQTRVLTAESLA